MNLLRSSAVLGLALLLSARPGSAQYRSSAGIERVGAAPAGRPVVFLPPRGVEGSRAAGAARGALIGAGVGAAVGVVVMALTPHRDHSEDTLGYVVGATGGAFFGLLVGATIGAMHPMQARAAMGYRGACVRARRVSRSMSSARGSTG